MATFSNTLFLAILISLFHFGDENKDIQIQFIKYDKTSYITLHPQLGKYLILSQDNEPYPVATGFVVASPDQGPYVYQFNEPEFFPAIDLSNIIKNFKEFKMKPGQLQLECRAENKVFTLQMKFKDDEIILVNEASSERAVIQTS